MSVNSELTVNQREISIKDSTETHALTENILNTPLDQISVNPFVCKEKYSTIDYFKIYGFGSILCFIRIIPMVLCALMSALTASLFMNSIGILKLIGIPTNLLKKFAKYVVFSFIRCCLFCSGFYWIKIIDKRGGNPLKPTIISVAPHSSFWDLLVWLKMGAPAIVSRYENSKMPIVGSVLSLCDPVYVKREDRNSRVKAGNDIKEKALVDDILLFPEGTCINGLALAQFKMGAFLPKLPVQPVVIKWNLGNVDTKSWVEEGPGIIQILFYTLGSLWTDCQIIKLAPYVPNDEERDNPRLFTDNVQRVMCDELGILQSFYSYDDVMFMGFANEIRIFRSPVCIKLLKVCYRIEKENSEQTLYGGLSKRIKTPKVFPFFNSKYLGLGEDFEHPNTSPDFYIPRALRKKIFKPRQQTTDSNSSAKKLPLSRVVRDRFDASDTPTPHIAVTSDVANEKRYIYEKFCTFIENSINFIEEKGEIRSIESTEDLAHLLGLDKSANTKKIAKSSTFVDLLKAIEFSTAEGPTTLHLLTALHLCDCREPNLWERLRAGVNLLSLQMKTSKTDFEGENVSPEPTPTLNLHYFKSLMWYSLGLQQFNDRFFIRQEFDFEFIQDNMNRLFKRAVLENAQSLLD